MGKLKALFRSVSIFHILLIIVVFCSGFIRFQQSSNYDFPFTYDQARDMLDIRVLGNFVDLKVSGPTTSITGLNLGPYYYASHLPAYWVGQGDPQYLVYWNILLFLGTAVIIFVFFYKRNRILGLLIASIFLMSPQLFTVTRYFWNAHTVVYFIVFYFLAFWYFFEKKTPFAALCWGLTAGLVIQFEAAFGSMCLLFAFFYVAKNKNWKMIRNFILASTPWFLPQVGYEVINGFQMTKLLVGMFTGANPILGEKLPLLTIIPLHFKTITSFFEGQFMLPYGLGMIVLVFSVVSAFINEKYRKIALAFLTFLVFAFLYYVVIYRHELKPWYLEGIRVWYCFIIGIGIVSFTKYRVPFYIFVTLFLLRNFYLTIQDQQVYVLDNGKSNDPKNASNIIQTISWVYEKADGEGFAAYNYVPETYDFSTQYIYSWYGTKKYGYTPSIVSYSLAPVPEYIRSETAFQKYRKENTSGNIALIYETIGDYEKWLVQFNEYCVWDEKDFPHRVKVEWRGRCK